jgi:hypothetical protein
MRLSSYAASAALMLWATSAMAQTAPPTATPLVTVGADIKLLIFDWDPVPGATYYQMYVDPDGHSGFSKIGGQIAAPATRAGVSIAVHLQHWQTALYRVAACNAAGCRNSKSLFPRRHMLETVGYFKASNTGPDNFGREVELSLDGNTLAVAAPLEASNATGVNGNQSDDSFIGGSGALYLYRKVSGHWKQEAYLKSPDNLEGRVFGGNSEDQRAMALSSNGSVLVVGATESVTQHSAGDDSVGEVVTFTRASNGTWRVANTLYAPAPFNGDQFGLSVDLSGDGNTLKVLGNTPGGVMGDTRTNYIYTRTDTGWELQQALGGPADPCRFSRMSGDGTTLLVHCEAPSYGSIYTYKRSGTTWYSASTLRYSPSTDQALAISYDSKWMALVAQTSARRVVKLYSWNDSGWSSSQSLEAPATYSSGFSNWAHALAFNQNGSLLAAGSAYFAPPAPAGITESLPDGTATTDGAVVVYRRQSTSPFWVFRSLVKAPNPDAGDRFGSSVALSGTGNTLAVGATDERSKATGIDGDRSDDSRASAGAAYLY